VLPGKIDQDILELWRWVSDQCRDSAHYVIPNLEGSWRISKEIRVSDVPCDSFELWKCGGAEERYD
jgi:hypothetical protein